MDKIEEILDKVSKILHTKDFCFLKKTEATFSFQVIQVDDIKKVITKMNSTWCEDIYGLNSLELNYSLNFLKEPKVSTKGAVSFAKECIIRLDSKKIVDIKLCDLSIWYCLSLSS